MGAIMKVGGSIMNRRQMLLLPCAAGWFLATSSYPRLARAQSGIRQIDEAIDDVLTKRPWSGEIRIFERYRDYALLMAWLRFLYGDPAEKERSDEYYSMYWDILYKTIGNTVDEGFGRVTPTGAYLDGYSGEIGQQLGQRAEENANKYFMWLELFGASADGALSIDLLRGQVFFAAFYLALESAQQDLGTYLDSAGGGEQDCQYLFFPFSKLC